MTSRLSAPAQAAQRPDRDVAEILNLVVLKILLRDEYGSNSPSQPYLSYVSGFQEGLYVKAFVTHSRVKYAQSLLMNI